MSVVRSIVRMLVLLQVIHKEDPMNYSSYQEEIMNYSKPKKHAKRPRPSSYQEEIMNYNKEDPMNVMHLCNKPCYNSSKERGTDERFWTFFHQDWYRTMLYPKSPLVVKQ
jgi:hypothetical protein